MPNSVKTVVIDIADNYGSESVIGIRSVEFESFGTPISVLSADITCYATSYGTTNQPWMAFDTSLSQTGTYTSTEWNSGYQVINKRLICVFDTPISFNKIIINNSHNSGAWTTRGAKNIKIYSTPDTVTDTTYNASVSNGELLFDGVLLEHTGSDAVDDQIVYNYTGAEFSVSVNIAVDLSGTSFHLYFPANVIIGVSPSADFEAGIKFEPSLLVGVMPSIGYNFSAEPTISYSLSCGVDPVISTGIEANIGMSYSSSTTEISAPIEVPISFLPRFSYGEMAIVYPTPEQLYPASVVSKVYRCMLGDLEIPISSFQIKARNGTPTYLEVSTPVWTMADDISDRSGDDLSVHIDYLVDGVVVDTLELAEVDFDLMTTYEGPISKTIVLSGHKTVWRRQPMATVSNLPADYKIGEGAVALASFTGGFAYPPPNSVTIPAANVSIIRTSGGLTSLELVETDFSLKTGDIVHHSGSSSFFANTISHSVGSSVHKVTVSE